jgi:hypothetical protein
MWSLLHKKVSLFQLCFLFATVEVCAQKNHLEFDTSKCPALIHGAAIVEVIDKRADTNAILGRIRVGIGNLEKEIYSEQPIAQAIANYYGDLSSKSKPSFSKLLVVLRTFYAYEEKPGFSSETAKIKYSADYFVSDNGLDFRLLGIVDTIITVKGFDVTRKLMRTIPRSLIDLYEGLYVHQIQPNEYNYQEVLNFENEEKKNLAAYNKPLPQNAVFNTWEEFKQLKAKPNESVFIKRRLFKIAYKNSKGKTKTAPIIYAKVYAYDGQLFYRIENNFYKLYQRDGDFFVTGKTSEFKSNNSNAFIVFGLVGGILITSNSPNFETYEFKIGHRKGDLIPIKLITKGKKLR